MPRSERKSVAAKLIGAAALAAALVPLSSIKSEASSITCGFTATPSSGGCSHLGSGAEGLGFSGDSAGFLFNSGPNEYQVNLTFGQVNGDFNVTVVDQQRTQAELDPLFAPKFAGYRCVPIDGSHCIEFFFTAPDPGPTTWDKAAGYQLDFSWAFDTENNGYPNGPGHIRVLHRPGTSDTFTLDNTKPGSYFGPPPPCTECCIECTGFFGEGVFDSDPGVSSVEDSFSSFTIADDSTAVPEPGSLALVASGVAVLLRRLRNRGK